MVKNPPASTGDDRDPASVPESRRSAAGGLGNPLQYSCLENLMDRGTWGTIDTTEWLSIAQHKHVHVYTSYRS